MGLMIKETIPYLPEQVITNDDLAKIVDTSDEWIVKRTGIKQRYYESSSQEQMLDKLLAKIKPLTYDAIIVTTMSNLNSAPTLSNYLATRLNVPNALCFDLNAACSGFVYAMLVANGLLASDQANRVLIVSIERMSNIVDQMDRSTVVLFGDGACATIVEKSQTSKLISSHVGNCPDEDDLVCRAGGYLKMNGQSVFKFATKTIALCLDQLLEKSELDIDEVDYFVFHQANIRIINNVIKKYKLDPKRVVINVDRFANTSSASIPLALSELQLKAGDRVAMIGFGAGLSYGAALYEH